MALKNLNKPVPRIEGAEKVSGRMRYAADIPVPAALIPAKLPSFPEFERLSPAPMSPA
jgi:CO/xanthine dehydrogenase Mo-binding subunit